MHMGNGSSSCQLRVKDPRDLADALEEIVNVLRSDEWLDKAFRVDDISQHLIETGELPMAIDEDIVDINDFKASMLETVDINRVDVEEIGKELLNEKGIQTNHKGTDPSV